MKRIILFFCSILPLIVLAQNPVQVIRGTVVDKDSKQPLIGATVIILNSNPQKGTISYEKGEFKLTEVAVGRQSLQISFLGYKPVHLNNLIVNSAKELVLNIELEESSITTETVVIVGTNKKDEAINKMAAVSARSFNVEETERYAGSRGDVARMAMNFAGVAVANDQRNDIVIRGNSPSGMLWRLDGIEIPNPNHFASMGTTGGPVGMLNNNTLANSDFFTSAFPAEYSNALSGVFDLNMRSGNNQKYENLFQVGFNGFEANMEGPLKKGYEGSFLATYRYSTVDLISKMGVNIGTSGIPKYQDYSFKIVLPFKRNKLTLFGLGGTSQISMLDTAQNAKSMYSASNYRTVNGSDMMTMGAHYMHYIGSHSYLKFTVSGLSQNGRTSIDTFATVAGKNDKEASQAVLYNTSEYKISSNLLFNSKINSQLSVRAGFIYDRLGFDLLGKSKYFNDTIFHSFIDNKKSLSTGPNMYRAYFQNVYKPNDKLRLHSGVHVMYFDLNKKYAIEPRLGASYSITNKIKINFGYGLHSKIQSLPVYYLVTRANNQNYETNKNLDFTKSHQWVVGTDIQIGNNQRLKIESYYQYLFNVPVTMNPSVFSILNSGATWGIESEDSLVNKGKGRNYGIEFTYEKFLNHGFYFLNTVSLFESKYTGSDGIERNTAFNGNYVLNCLGGKEFIFENGKVLAFDLKFTYAGGKRYIPIDLAKSKIAGDAVYNYSDAYNPQFNDFFKMDVKVSFKINQKRIAHEWQLYVENVTNHNNPLFQQYDKKSNTIYYANQLGIFPMMLYRLYF